MRGSWPLERLRDSAAVCAVAALIRFVGMQSRAQFADVDLWGRFAAAALWHGTGRFPYSDALSFTAAGRPWVDHEWLSASIFLGVMRAFGEPGLLVLKFSVLAACVGLTFWMHRRIWGRGGGLALAGFLAFGSLIGLGFTAVVRCQVFSFLFTLVFLACLERVRREPRRLWELAALVPLGVLWANIHGGLIVGLLLLGAYAVGEAVAARAPRRATAHVLTAGAILFAGAFLNPYGPRYLAFLARAWTLDRSLIGEWNPVWTPSPDRPIRLALVALAGALMIWRGFHAWKSRRGPASAVTGPVLAIALFLVMAVRAVRFGAFLGFGAVALAPELLEPSPAAVVPAFDRWGQRATAAILAFDLFTGVTAFGQGAHPLSAPIPPVASPVNAVRYLAGRHEKGRLAATFVAGEFAAWTLYPDIKVALDGRFEEVYPLDVARAWLGFFGTRAEEAGAAGGRWARDQGADWVLLRADQAGAARSLEESGLWTRVLFDPTFSLYGLAARADLRPAARPVAAPSPGSCTIADFFDENGLARFGSSGSKAGSR